MHAPSCTAALDRRLVRPIAAYRVSNASSPPYTPLAASHLRRARSVRASPPRSPPLSSALHLSLRHSPANGSDSGTYRCPLPVVRKVCAHAAIFIPAPARTCCRQPTYACVATGRASQPVARQGRCRRSMNSNTSTACPQTLTRIIPHRGKRLISSIVVYMRTVVPSCICGSVSYWFAVPGDHVRLWCLD